MGRVKNSSSESFLKSGLAGGVIVLAALAVYANSFSGPFIYDDVVSITQNPTIRHLWPVGRVLSPPMHLTVSGRPLVNFSLALNRALSGDAVWSYHALNVLIHILAGLALFGLVRRTLLRPVFAGLPPSLKLWRTSLRASPPALDPGASGQRSNLTDSATGLAFAVALLWVVHPLQTESVTYVIQRAESLMGLFYLLTLYCFVRGVESARTSNAERRTSNAESPTTNYELPTTERRRLSGYSSSLWMLASVGACLLGMASKEVMVSAPLMVLLYDRTFVAGSFRAAWQQRRKLYLGLAGTWLLLGYLVAMTGDRGGTAGFGEGISERTYVLTQFRAIVHYLRLSVWPQPLVFDYGQFVLRQVAEAAPYAAIILTLVILTVVGLRRNHALGFLGVWFFAILAPSSSVVPVVTETMAEHRMYLALAAVITVIVFGLYALIGRRSVAICLALAVVLGVLAARRNRDYRSELAIWSDTVAKCPGNARAHCNLGAALAVTPGRLTEAVSEYEEALQIQPDYPGAHNNLGCILTNIPGRRPEAIGQFEAELRLKPDFAEAHNNLGNALAAMPGRLPEAIGQFETALRLKPDFAEAHNNLGNALAAIPGLLPEAISHFETALRLKPDFAEAHNNLGTALAEIPGQLPEAVGHFETAVQLRPDYTEAFYNLGKTLAEIPSRQTEAVSAFAAALRLDPNDAAAHSHLGSVLANIPGRLPEAISHFETALRIEPDNAVIHYNLGIALNETGRTTEAIFHFKEAVRLNPGYAEAHYNLGTSLGQSGRMPEAISELEAAVRLKPDYAEAHNNLGLALYEAGRTPEAIDQFKEVLRIRPDSPDVRALLEKLQNAAK